MINSKEMCREEISFIRILERDLQKFQEIDREEKIKNLIAKMKLDVRDCYRRQEKEQERRIVKADYDGMVELIQLPELIKSKEAAERYMEEFEVLHAMPSQYDCTGQRFTVWYKVFERRGRFFAYHAIAMDV